MASHPFNAAWVPLAQQLVVTLDLVDESQPIADVADWMAREVRAALFARAEVACAKCEGRGRYLYPNTATWRSRRGMVSGMAMTEDVCDECWGSGRSDSPGEDLRTLEGRV